MIVDTTWSERSDTSRDEVRIDILGGIDLSPIIRCLTIKGSDTIKFGRARSIWNVTSHLQSLVCGHEGKSLHWICLEGFPRGHVEESRVEEPRVFDPASIRSVTRVPCLSCGISVCLDVVSV